MLTPEQLHGYQRYAADFIVEHSASAILLDCGCGKTIITLTAIEALLRDRFEISRVLVICPIRVAQVWAEELSKWSHLRGLRYSIAVGTESQRRYALGVDADIYIVNRDVVPWLVENYAGNWRWDMLVLDELSSFKNPQAKRFKALLKVRPKVRRIVAELKVLPVSVLKPAEYNPRKKLKAGDKEYEKIKASIEEFGFADPLVVNSDMTIIGGHQRLTVAMDLGYTEVPCAVVDIDKVREKALNIALNKITGAWDDTMLAELLEDIQNSNFDLGKTGFDPPEINTLFNKLHDKQVHEDDFDVDSELQQPVFSQLGDLWLIGKHRVICGDSTGEEIYTRLMDGDLANLVLTDPPYNVDVEETAGKIMNDNMGDQEFYNFLLSAYRCMHANLADDGSIYVWHADTEGLNFRKAFKDAGFYLSGCCIWKKNSLVLGRSPYQWIHEPCLFGWKQKGKHQWYSDRKQTTVWEYDKPRSSKDHPTMKPVTLMSYPIKNSTMTNGIVLDPFLGSGSTLIACMQTDRVCRGIELDPKFVDVIVKRAIQENGGKYDDVFVIRDGQKLRFDEVASFEPQEVEA